METFKAVLIGFTLLLGLGWVSVLIVMLLDKVRGRPITNFCSGGVYHLPKIRPLAWWQHVLRLPLYCVFIPCFSIALLIFIPPMWIVAFAGKTKVR